MDNITSLLSQIRACQHCTAHLPLGAKPIISFAASSKIALISQAPGIQAHNKGIPYQDQSGIRLRNWLGVDEVTFYDTKHFAILPMGFCYPGKSKSGDLPPRKECAPLWHKSVWEVLQQVELTLLIGQYAQHYYLKNLCSTNLTETVRNYEVYLPTYFPLIHPSPLNQIWLKKNTWYETEVIPALREKIRLLIG